LEGRPARAPNFFPTGRSPPDRDTRSQGMTRWALCFGVTMRPLMRNLRRAAGSALLLALVACGSDDPPGQTFYEREIQPILVGSCAGNTGGCHAGDSDESVALAAATFA